VPSSMESVQWKVPGFGTCSIYEYLVKVRVDCISDTTLLINL
jgi:hypothetical protein